MLLLIRISTKHPIDELSFINLIFKLKIKFINNSLKILIIHLKKMTKFLKSTLIRNRFKSNLIKNLRSRKNIINNSKSSFTKINDKKREIPDQQDIGKEMPTNKSIKSIRRSEKFKEKKEKEVLIPQMSLESLKDHYYTFNLITELYSILYTTLIFKWIQTDRVILIFF